MKWHQSKTIKAFLLSAALLTGGCPTARGCTSFALFRGKDALVGNVLEWFNGSGWVTVNKRNVAKSSLALEPGDRPIDWTSLYGSVTFNQHGREFPLGGINEKGLVVEAMVGGDQDAPIDSRPTVNEIQWVQFQLDNYQSVAEVVAHASDLRVSKIAIRLHYMVCDRNQDCAAVEPFYDKHTRVSSGPAFKITALTNSSYADSMGAVADYVGFGGTKPIPEGNASLDRFVRAAWELNRYESPVPLELGYSTAFEILSNSIWQPHGNMIPQWNIVYDLNRLQIHFRTYGEPGIKTFSVADFDYSCTTPVRTFHMNQNLDSQEVSSLFRDYSSSENELSVRRGMKILEDYLPAGTAQRFIDYPSTTSCRR